jgi:hypothetical protein
MPANQQNASAMSADRSKRHSVMNDTIDRLLDGLGEPQHRHCLFGKPFFEVLPFNLA